MVLRCTVTTEFPEGSCSVVLEQGACRDSQVPVLGQHLDPGCMYLAATGILLLLPYKQLPHLRRPHKILSLNTARRLAISKQVSPGIQDVLSCVEGIVAQVGVESHKVQPAQASTRDRLLCWRRLKRRVKALAHSCHRMHQRAPCMRILSCQLHIRTLLTIFTGKYSKYVIGNILRA